MAQPENLLDWMEKKIKDELGSRQLLVNKTKQSDLTDLEKELLPPPSWSRLRTSYDYKARRWVPESWRRAEILKSELKEVIDVAWDCVARYGLCHRAGLIGLPVATVTETTTHGSYSRNFLPANTESNDIGR